MSAKYVSRFSDNFAKPWCHLLQRCEDHYNTTKHKLTQAIPLELCTGFRWHRDPESQVPARGEEISFYEYNAMYHTANSNRANYSCKILAANVDPRKKGLGKIEVGSTVLARHPKTKRGFENRPLTTAVVTGMHIDPTTAAVKFDLKWEGGDQISKKVIQKEPARAYSLTRPQPYWHTPIDTLLRDIARSSTILTLAYPAPD